MITWDLTTFDWTAIGSIVTFLALIATFVALFFSNKQEKKNRQLQVLLLKKEQQQSRLDEMVTNILEMIADIDPLHQSIYSKKIQERRATAEDRCRLDDVARKDQCNYNKLQLQIIKLENYAAAKPMLEKLNTIRTDYGVWIKSTVMILYYLQDTVENQRESIDIIKRTYHEMVAKCLEMAPHSKRLLESCRNPFNDNLIDLYINVLTVFSFESTQKLLKDKEIFMNELKAFIKSEQDRIDNIVNADE